MVQSCCNTMIYKLSRSIHAVDQLCHYLETIFSKQFEGISKYIIILLVFLSCISLIDFSILYIFTHTIKYCICYLTPYSPVVRVRTIGYNIKQDRQCTCNATLKSVLETIVVMEKQKLLNILRERDSVCVCVCVCARARASLGIEHSKRMHRIILSSLVSLAPPYLSTSSHTRNDFRKKLFNTNCVL
jgi:hypothetical protein